MNPIKLLKMCVIGTMDSGLKVYKFCRFTVTFIWIEFNERVITHCEWEKLEGRGRDVLERTVPVFTFGTSENEEKSEERITYIKLIKTKTNLNYIYIYIYLARTTQQTLFISVIKQIS